MFDGIEDMFVVRPADVRLWVYLFDSWSLATLFAHGYILADSEDNLRNVYLNLGVIWLCCA